MILTALALMQFKMPQIDDTEAFVILGGALIGVVAFVWKVGTPIMAKWQMKLLEHNKTEFKEYQLDILKSNREDIKAFIHEIFQEEVDAGHEERDQMHIEMDGLIETHKETQRHVAVLQETCEGQSEVLKTFPLISQTMQRNADNLAVLARNIESIQTDVKESAKNQTDLVGAVGEIRGALRATGKWNGEERRGLGGDRRD